jgi:protein-S-isoprenylcysteine O-methyltransferase Ste14
VPIRHKNLLHVWLALTLTIIFSHPLFATLHDNDIILQWRIQSSWELIAAVALITLLLTGALWLIATMQDMTP